MAIEDFFGPGSTFGSALTAVQNDLSSQAGTGLLLRPSNAPRSGGFGSVGDSLRTQLDAMKTLARQMEERRKREEEERKRREEAARVAARNQAQQFEQEVRRDAQREELSTPTIGIRQRVFDWGLQLVGANGGFGEGDQTALGVNPAKLGLNSFDDLKEMATNPSRFFLEKDPTFREFFDLRVSDDEDELRQGVMNTQFELGRRGYNQEIINSVIMDWFEDQDVRSSFRPTGVSVTGQAPGFDILAEETNPLVADIARIGAGTALGFVNPAAGAAFFGGTVGISGGETSGREFAGDAIRAVTEGLIFSRAANLLEDPVVAAAGQAASRGIVRPVIGGAAPGLGRRAAGGVASLGARGATRAGLNVAEDIPATAAELAVRGFSAEEMFPILIQQAAVSGAGGAAVPILGDTFRGLGRANRAVGGGVVGEVAKPAATGITAYTTAKALGASDEQAEVAAVAAVAATSGPLLRRVAGGLPEPVLQPLRRLGGSVTEMPEIPRNAFDNARVPEGKVLVYHGTTDAFEGPIRDGINVTPRFGDAAAFQRASARLGQRQGGQVLAMLVDSNNVRRLDGFVGARGGLEVIDGSKVQVLGRVGAEADSVRPFDFEAFSRAQEPDTPRVLDEQGRPVEPQASPRQVPDTLRAVDEPNTVASRRQRLRPFREVELPDEVRARVEGEVRTHPNVVARRNARVARALDEYAFGRSSLSDADWQRLEAQRTSVIAENQRRVANFQEPLPVPNGDVRIRMREYLGGQYGDIDIPDNVRPEAAADFVLDQIADRARFASLRNSATAGTLTPSGATRPGAEAAPTPQGPQVFGQDLLTRGPSEPGAVAGGPTPPAAAPPTGRSGPPSPPPPDIPGRVQARQLPDPDGMDVATREATDKMRELSNRATALTSSRRLASRALGPAGRIVDPATKLDTAPKKIAHGGVVAATNSEQAAFTGIADEVAILKPLIGETTRRHLARATAEVIAPLSMIGVAYADDGEIGGLRDEILIATGFGTMAGLSQAFAAGKFSGMPLNSVRLRQEAEAVIRAKFGDEAYSVWREVDKIPGGKLSHVLENPELYELTPAQIRAITDFEALRTQRLAETNAWRLAAGEPPIRPNEFNRIFHGIDADSYKAQFPNFRPENPLIEINVPGRLQEAALARQRQLGQTWGDLHRDYPMLRPVKDVAALLAEEARQHSQIRARSTLLYHLKRNGMVEFFPDPDSFPDQVTRNAAADRAKELGNRGWITVPGIDKHLIDPEAAGVVKDLLAPLDQGGGFLRNLDSATVAVRTAMFTMDLSAWTLQGAMLAINRPMTFLRHGHDLILATASDRWFRHLQNRNDDWFEASASGARLGREFGGLETRAGGKLNPTNIPAIGVMERAGFERFLPTARMFIQRDLARQEAFFEALSKFGFKAPVIGDMARLLEFAPAGGYAAFQAARQEDIDPMTMATLLMVGFGAGMIRDFAGGRFLQGLPEGQRLAAETRAGKMTTRTGGTLQREVLGITPGQSRVERSFFFRSPALTRNALTLMGTALNPGAEGQMARAYLVKSAMTYTAALAALKFAVTGEMDSFNPMDPDSILSVENLSKLEVPGVGSISFSNPVVSAMRYILYQDRPETQEDYDWGRWNPAREQFWHDKVHGANRFITGRTTDVLGKLVNPGIDIVTDELVGGETRDVFDRGGPTEARPGDALRGFTQGLLPLPIQEALESGIAQRTQLGSAAGDVLGVESNPAFDSLGEQVSTIVGTFSGINVNPESLGRTIVRLREEEVRRQFGDDATYARLNRTDKASVNAALNNDDAYQRTVEALDEANKDAPLRNVDRYFEEQAKVRDDFVAGLKEAQRLVDRGKRTRSWFRNRRSQLIEERRVKLDQLEEQYSEISAQRPGTEESVIEYLNRNITPEDQAVDGYFDLFEQATTAGDLDFDLLENLQEEYLDGLPREHRRYVEERISQFGAREGEVPLVDEYNEVKETLAPFWELRSDIFDEFRSMGGFLSQFENEDEFEAFLAREASAIPGLTADDMLDILTKTVPEVAAYADFTSFAQKAMRLSDPDVDRALVDWYDFTPANRITYAAGTLGFDVPSELAAQLGAGILSGNVSNSVRNTFPFLVQLAERGRRFQDSPTEFVSVLRRQAERQ